MNRKFGSTAALASLALLVACGGSDDDGAPAPAPSPATPLSAKEQCDALNGLTIAATDMTLATRGAKITATKFVDAAPQSTNPTTGAVTLAAPEYCQASGEIAPVDVTGFPIKFAVNLPTNWNKKAMHFGGAGLNGSIPGATRSSYPQRGDLPGPLANGYLTFSGDSGHTGDNAAFMLNYEATVNFGYASLKKTKDVAFLLAQKRYGGQPERTYCIGRSNGGRDCMAAVQHYPTEYDGIVAADAVMNYTADMLHNMRIAKSLIDGGWLSPAKLKLLGDASRAACDSADGLADGRILNSPACHVDPTPLRCASGTDEGDTCLSDAQLRTARIIENPVTPLPLANGAVYPGFQWAGGEDSPTDGWTRMYMGTAVPLQVEPAGGAAQPGIGLILGYGRSVVRYWFGRSDSYQSYTFDESQYQAEISQLSSIIDATNPDLGAFFAHGGKLIFKDNSADFAQSPLQRIEYIAAMRQLLGNETVDNGVRWFNGAGAGHFDAEGYGVSDFVGMIENWVEKGQAPVDQVAVGIDAKLNVVRTQPLCIYPAYPRYKGSGDVNVAASYACTAP